jgi:hypothetical protein
VYLYRCYNQCSLRSLDQHNSFFIFMEKVQKHL